jgi:hypothetical protein
LRWLRVEHDRAGNINGEWGYRALNAAHQCTMWRRIQHIEGDVGGLWSVALAGLEVELLVVDTVLDYSEDVNCMLDVLGRIQLEMLEISLRARGVHGELFKALCMSQPRLDILHIEVTGNEHLGLDFPREDENVRANAVSAFLVRSHCPRERRF